MILPITMDGSTRARYAGFSRTSVSNDGLYTIPPFTVVQIEAAYSSLYYIGRCFGQVDLSSVPFEWFFTCTLYVYGVLNTYNPPDLVVQESTYTLPFVAETHLAFNPPITGGPDTGLFGKTSGFVVGAWNSITFNATGLAYLNAMLESTKVAKFGFRTAADYYDNVPPPNYQSQFNVTTNPPYLEVTGGLKPGTNGRTICIV